MASPLEQLRELVETSIESDDVGPLVKAVFEVQPPGEAMPPPLRGAGATSESAATTSLADGQLPAGTSPLDAVLEMLGEVAEEKEAEIAQICRANATEISGAMHELGALQRHTASLRQQLLSNNGELQAAGAAFAARVEEVQEVTALQQGVADARKAVGAALAVLRLCARAAQLIDSKQLFKAYKTLETIQRDHGPLLRGGYSAEARPLLPSNAATAGGSAAPQAGGAAAAASTSRAAAAAAGEARTPVNPAVARMQQGRQVQRADTFQVTGDLLDGVDMAPLHRCLHIHACLGRLPQFADYYAENRRQQLAADLALHGSGDFLEHYQAYLTQLVGFFLVEDAVQRQAGSGGEQGLDVVAQVDAAWDAAVVALKRVLEPAFSGATAAAQMLTVKDFLLLSCLALDHCGYQTVAIREMLVASRPKYFQLLGDATQAAVKAVVGKDGLSPVEVRGAAEVEQLFRQLALPVTFRAEDAGNKRPPFRAPFSSMVPELVRIVRGHVVDSVAYLKGLLTAGEVASAARQAPDRQLTRILTDTLQQRVDAAAGDRELPATTALQLVANIAALIHAMAPLEEFALAQARGDTAEIVAAAAAAAAEQAAQRSRSPSPGRRSRSRSPGKGDHLLVIAAKAAPLLAASAQLDWAPSDQARSTAYSPHVDEMIMYLKESASLVTRMAPGPSVARMLRSLLRYLGDAFMLQLLSDAIPEFNIFGLQRLFNDLGGISRAAGSVGVPGLADELAEPLLFCEMMVFGSLEELLRPELRTSPKYACLDLGRVARVLDKYAELDKASGYRGMHKSKQAERFISRKTVDKVLKELRELAKALALLGTSEPICWVDALDGAEEVDAVCPGGTYKDDNNPYCYEACSVFDNSPLQGVKYINSTQNDDHCFPQCPPNLTKLKGTTSAITCFNCPAGYAPVANKGCYTKCGVANTTMAGYPEAVNWPKNPVCAQSCAVLYPKTFSKPATDDPNKCTDGNGNYKTRLTRARTLIAPSKTVKLPVVAKSEVDMGCPTGSDPYSLWWDDTPPDEPHQGCYTCPPGQITAIYKTEWVYCMPAGCPDNKAYTRSGHFCWSNALASVFGGLTEEDTVAFLNMFDCLPKCFELPPDPPASKKGATAKAMVAMGAARPRPTLTSKDGPPGKP
ncbi:exocyst complex component SEC15A [Chlorella sorokiniana]|uniref:Exocyst complex component SEC15A n=1 Tax=Chlorella sorokiniana TaxID=3076 RepID=A0A2P6TVJ3_CHLSO|nr:exocyst complex component SEC15A [Chlorella sorokiniana]|eukprot:PRW58081.1 exocyst complex component SEC15A [Chlorella sorokiniana]